MKMCVQLSVYNYNLDWENLLFPSNRKQSNKSYLEMFNDLKECS